MKLTPVLFVDRIEPSLPFWTERLGFTMTVSVPEGDHLGFAIFAREGAEVMLQTWTSAEADTPQMLLTGRNHKVALFLEIDDFDAALRQVQGCPVYVTERTTFYGTREIGVVEPGGHYVLLAARSSS